MQQIKVLLVTESKFTEGLIKGLISSRYKNFDLQVCETTCIYNNSSEVNSDIVIIDEDAQGRHVFICQNILNYNQNTIVLLLLSKLYNLYYPKNPIPQARLLAKPFLPSDLYTKLEIELRRLHK